MSATNDEGKAILESQLGQLLGFDDGASDILDHLITIESREVRLRRQRVGLLFELVGFPLRMDSSFSIITFLLLTIKN